MAHAGYASTHLTKASKATRWRKLRQCAGFLVPLGSRGRSGRVVTVSPIAPVNEFPCSSPEHGFCRCLQALRRTLGDRSALDLQIRFIAMLKPPFKFSP